MKKRMVLASVLTVCFAWTMSALAAALNPGNTLWNPDVAGEAHYTAGLTPAGDLVATMDSDFVPFTLVSGSKLLTGSVTTNVYDVDGMLAFEYIFTSTGAAELVRASLGGDWTEVGILDAGADGSGSSTQGWINPTWNDGDPIYIGRTAVDEQAPFIQWRDANRGTFLVNGDVSSKIWLQTDMPEYTLAPVGLINSGATSQAWVYVPIPEPSMLALLGLGVLGVGLRRRFRG